CIHVCLQSDVSPDCIPKTRTIKWKNVGFHVRRITICMVDEYRVGSLIRRLLVVFCDFNLLSRYTTFGDFLAVDINYCRRDVAVVELIYLSRSHCSYLLRTDHGAQNLLLLIQSNCFLLFRPQDLSGTREQKPEDHSQNCGINDYISIRLLHVVASLFYLLLLHNNRSMAPPRS